MAVTQLNDTDYIFPVFSLFWLSSCPLISAIINQGNFIYFFYLTLYILEKT